MPSFEGKQERGLGTDRQRLRGVWTECSKPRVHDLRARRLLRIGSRSRARSLSIERTSPHSRASNLGALVYMVLRLQCVFELATPKADPLRNLPFQL